MSQMFYECYSLKSIDLSNFNPPKEQSMSAIFYNCISLSSINLKNIKCSVDSIFGVSFFKGCKNLTIIDISFFWTSESELALFDELPSKGEIIVNASLIDIIRNQIPDEWNITTIE